MGNLLSTDRSWNPGPAGGWRKAGNDKATLGETGRVEGEGAGARTNPERQKCDGEPGRGVDREMKQRKKRETVRPRKDRAAAPAYQLFQESSAGISINSNDKCGPLWHRLINSARGGTRQSKNFKSFNATGLNKCSERACWALLCFGITTVPLHVMEQLEPFYITV